ncbi:Anti-sigma-factor antagonist [Sterolibacterium denitrificans]|uniref:Anti-sigma-factor antagonist n=2 Tax=Sterolibacterium denitrificans TaxID=157592 RepID=A0A7Z7HS98_9PROT|nr:STAS domain-containing protein [Sterolibacterium denitrificans]KYC29168.1 anti-sigma B factor antagonist [Sterolibacterium denitrificans]SMB29405.1 Anti-sigma-factor antagonist [Sterolibacterium denitrificans]
MSHPENAAKRMIITEDMTIYHAEALKEKLIHGVESSDMLELDLSGVAEIDTAGIQLLMLAKRESQACGKSLNIIAHSPAVHELIDFFNIAGYFGDPLVIPARQPA